MSSVHQISVPGGLPDRKPDQKLMKKGLICSVKILFSSDDCPLAPTLPPWGAGAHSDAPVLPEREISQRLRTGNTIQSQSGDAREAGAYLHAPQRASELFTGFPMRFKQVGLTIHEKKMSLGI
jgi:hypothetical protein